MAVKVISNDPHWPDGSDYDSGQEVAIRDGHLIVGGSGSKVIAIFAPGSWVAAEVK